MDVYDTKYSAKIGANTARLMKDSNVSNYVIKNISSIKYSNFDTLILGHMDELSAVLKNDNYAANIIAQVLQQGKNIFSFDNINHFGFAESDNVYFPSITSQNVPQIDGVCSIVSQHPL